MLDPLGLDPELAAVVKGQIGIIGNFGVGAPVVGVLVEDLVAFGVKQFVAIGLAGGLQEGLKTGDLVVAQRAIRDEGTSYHYLADTKYAMASPVLTEQIHQLLNAKGYRHQAGTSWTIDAPYRETYQEANQYRREGVLTVEMEAATLFAVAEFLNVDACAAFAVSDVMTDGRWQLDFDTKLAHRGLERLFDVAIQALTL